MCKQAGRVQLEQSDLRLALNTQEKFETGLTPANVNETLDIGHPFLADEIPEFIHYVQLFLKREATKVPQPK
jgi:hypothetical protein